MGQWGSSRATATLLGALICMGLGFALGWLTNRRPIPPATAQTGLPTTSYTAAAPPGSDSITTTTRSSSGPTADTPAAKRVVIVSIDGLRPDLLASSEAPHIRELLRSSAFTLWAQTVDHPYVYTLPAHVTMLTGVHPDRHGVTWNDYIEWYPNVPTLFEYAKAGGLTTAMTTGKMKFVALNKPGTIDWVYLPPDEPVTDEAVASEAVQIMRDHRPHLLFVHLPGVDTVGHEKGWGSVEQRNAVNAADAAVRKILVALHDLELADSTLLIVTADHGGAGLGHWGDDPRSRTIPWIARGPGVRHGYDLTRHPNLEVRTADTFATAAVALGLKLPSGVDANPVEAIYADRELLQPER